MMKMDGLILAGGKSSRMGGTHKGNLLLGTETFTGRMVNELRKEAEEVWISYGEMMHESYEGCRIVRDEYPGCGPIGGLQAGLRACTGEAVMAAACDMPFLKIELFRYLEKCLEEEEKKQGEALDGVVPVLEGRINPLAAIYKKSAGDVLERQIQEEDYRIRGALRKMKILYVNLDGDKELGKMLQNINTLSEYQKICKLEK